MKKRCLLGWALAAVCVAAGVELDPTNPWRVVDGTTTLEIAPVDVVKVADARLEKLPTRPKNGWPRWWGGWKRGLRLPALMACECSVKGALMPESVVVRRLDGTVLAVGKDYELEGEWGCLARLPEGTLGAEEAVRVDYAYRAQRLDRVVRTATGTVVVRRGTPQASNPELPALQAGDIALATIWLNSETRRLQSRNLYRVREQAFPEAPIRGASVAERLLPKTWAKLTKGEPVTVLAWGDSVTEASYLPQTDRWQEQFVRRLRKRFPKSTIRLVSNGWGGRTSGTFLDVKLAPPGSPHNYVEKVLGVGADLVVMEFVNDAELTALDTLRARYDRIRADLTARGAELCVLTPHYIRADWMGLPDPTATTEDPRPYVKNLRAWSTQAGVALADASLRWGRLAGQGIPYQTLLKNEINHPNAFGMTLFADALMDLFRGGEDAGQ